MSLQIEEEVKVTFDFQYARLAGETVDFVIGHESFPYEAEVTKRMQRHLSGK